MRYFLLLIWIGLLSCCTTVAPPPVAPIESTEGLADRLMSRVEANARAFEGLSGMAKIRINHPERKVNANQVLFVQKPDRFRAEILSPFGNPLLMTAANGEQLDAYVPSEGTFYRGDPSLENLQRFIPIPLRLSDLVHAMLYDPLLISFQERRILIDDEGYRLELLADKGVRQQIFFDGHTRLVRTGYYVDDELHMGIDYGNFTDSDPAFPLSIQIEMPLYRTEVSVSLRDIEVNPEIPAERFSLVPPAGVKIEPFP